MPETDVHGIFFLLELWLVLYLVYSPAEASIKKVILKLLVNKNLEFPYDAFCLLLASVLM